jgi:hypothetical protein
MNTIPSSLVFLQLSDIHFRKDVSGKTYDLDNDLRNMLELDTKEIVKRIGGISGVIISGDIAFAGQKDEYITALEWLEKLCDSTGCSRDNVWCVPGNHDVDRLIVSRSIFLDNAHKALRPQNSADVDELIGHYMQDEQANDLYRPIEKYNQLFAEKFRCNIDSKKPYWEQDFLLNDGSTLRIRGNNSTLVSDSNDNDAANKLIIGSYQATPTKQSGVEYIVVCHHPPSWLIDQDQVEEIWNARARIQLFGHKHKQKITSVNERSIILIAGAMHPDRREPNWLPCYNFLEICVENRDNKRYLKVVVYPRIWSSSEMQFQADYSSQGSDSRTYNIELEPWEMETPTKTENNSDENIGQTDMAKDDLEDNSKKVNSNVSQVMDPARMLTYQYLSLPHHKRVLIAQKLGLIEDNDEGLRDGELFALYFQRAREKAVLESLWSMVVDAYEPNEKNQNPFKGR